jgi:hypothetical protein
MSPLLGGLFCDFNAVYVVDVLLPTRASVAITRNRWTLGPNFRMDTSAAGAGCCSKAPHAAG